MKKKLSMITFLFVLLFSSKIFSQPLPSSTLGQYCFEKHIDGLYLRLEICQPWQFGSLVTYYVSEKNNPNILIPESYRTSQPLLCSSPYVGLFVYFNINNYPSVLNSVNNPTPPNVAPYMDFQMVYDFNAPPAFNMPYYISNCSTCPITAADKFCESQNGNESPCNSNFEVKIKTELQGSILSNYTYPFSLNAEPDLIWLNNTPPGWPDRFIYYVYEVNDNGNMFNYISITHNTIPVPPTITHYAVSPGNFTVKLTLLRANIPSGMTFSDFYNDFLNNIYHSVSGPEICSTEYNFCLGTVTSPIENKQNNNSNSSESSSLNDIMSKIIKSEIVLNKIYLFPNPSLDGNFKINTNDNNFEKLNITITSIDGKIVYDKEFNKSEIENKFFNFGRLAKGVYQYKIKTERESFNNQIVIE